MCNKLSMPFHFLIIIIQQFYNWPILYAQANRNRSWMVYKLEKKFLFSGFSTRVTVHKIIITFHRLLSIGRTFIKSISTLTYASRNATRTNNDDISLKYLLSPKQNSLRMHLVITWRKIKYYRTCSSSVRGWKAKGSTGLFLQMESNISSSFGISTSSLNNASISSFPYRCSASLYLGPGEGGGDVTLFPLDNARSLYIWINN